MRVITISQKPNEINIKINDNAEQQEIVKELKKKVTDLEKLYKEEKTPIKITGKVLKAKEMEEIQRIIKEKIKVEIEFDTPKDLGLSRNKKGI